MSYLNRALIEGRRELILLGKEVAKEIDENGLDPVLFKAVQLNYLSITDAKLKVVPPGIGELHNLVNLVLHTNSLKELPSEIGQLKHLKHLDVSRNSLTKLPNEISNLKEIETLNVSFNQLTEIPSLKNNVKLHVLDISYNKFENFPDILYTELNSLSELKLDSNKIKHIPSSVRLLASLKILFISNNQLSSLPLEVGLVKLKDVKFTDNQFTDKQLKKLVSSGNTKKILEYIKKHCTSSVTNDSKMTTAADIEGKGTEESENQQVVEHVFSKYIQTELNPGATVVRMESAIDKRKFILCCIVKNVNFDEESFRNFLRLQNTLHASCCEDRALASIGTHDFDLLTSKSIIYTCRDPNKILFKPLGSDTNITAAEFFAEQKSKAEKLNKRKRSSGILKYIHMLDGAQMFPCLMTEDEKQVISLPPITNSEDTKMSINTKNIFIEVTSQHSQPLCKEVMENLLIELCQLGIGDKELNSADIVGECSKLQLAAVEIKNSRGANYLKFPKKGDLLSCSEDVKIVFI